MQFDCGSKMWVYLVNRFNGTVNDQTRAMTKRRLYAQLEATRCKANGDVEGHMNNMSRLHSRLQAVGMTLDDTVFSGMLVSSLPAGERFDRLRGMVEMGMENVNTPEKVMMMAITFDQANKADVQLARAFGGSSSNGQTAGQGQDKKKGGQSRKSKKNGDESKYQPQRTKDMEQRLCFKCHKAGHRRQDCPQTDGSCEGATNRAEATFTLASGFAEPTVESDSAVEQYKQARDRHVDGGVVSEQQKLANNRHDRYDSAVEDTVADWISNPDEETDTDVEDCDLSIAGGRDDDGEAELGGVDTHDAALAPEPVGNAEQGMREAEPGPAQPRWMSRGPPKLRDTMVFEPSRGRRENRPHIPVTESSNDEYVGPDSDQREGPVEDTGTGTGQIDEGQLEGENPEQYKDWDASNSGSSCDPADQSERNSGSEEDDDVDDDTSEISPSQNDEEDDRESRSDMETDAHRPGLGMNPDGEERVGQRRLREGNNAEPANPEVEPAPFKRPRTGLLALVEPEDRTFDEEFVVFAALMAAAQQEQAGQKVWH
ncbi:hypothetical protein BBJ28_00022889, partial [Nothophytophthora sp. Chile5]